MFTFLGLAVNSWAAALFAMGMFRQAAAVLFLGRLFGYGGWASGAARGAGDGVWRFFGFDAGPLFGFGFVHGIGGALHADGAAVLYGAGGGGDGEFVHGELFAGAGGINYSFVQSGIHGAAGAAGAADHGRCVQSDGAGAVGDRSGFDDYGDSSRCLYVAGAAGGAVVAGGE